MLSTKKLQGKNSLFIAFLSPPSHLSIYARSLSSFTPHASSIPLPFRHQSSSLKIHSYVRNPAFQYARMYSSAAEQTEAPTEERMNFSDIKLIAPLQKSLDKTFRYKKMSIVQEKVLLTSTTEKADLLVRAKTGTGKTLAFLASAIQRLQQDPVKWQRILDGRAGISILIISPTRELAIQIQQEARKLCSFLPLKSVVCCGGDSRNVQLEQIHRGCDIVVATPGRLLDFLNSARLFQDKIKDNQVLILDEADRLLEMGFKQDIEEVCRIIPQERQTLCFSATFSREMRRVAESILKTGYTSLDCVPADEVDTHLKIRQSYIEASFSQTLPTMLDLFNKHKEANPNFKIIVFFPTAVSTGFFAQLFNWTAGFGQVLEIHSRLTQAARARVSRQFRESRNSILFTTDVSARGVDYPGVTLVLQVGIPKCRDDYIHRIGRTGRANKSGEAILLLSPYEAGFLRQIGDLPIKADVRYSAAASASKPELVAAMKTAMDKFTEDDKSTIFTAWCGGSKDTVGKYYSGPYQKPAEDFAKNILGLQDIPSMSPSLANKLGLSGGGGGSRRGAFGSGMFGRDRSPSYSSGGFGGSSYGSNSYGSSRYGGSSSGYGRSGHGGSGYGGSSSGYGGSSSGGFGGFRSERSGGYGNDRSGGYNHGRNDSRSEGGARASLADFMRLRERMNK